MRAMIPAVALIGALLLSACGIKGPLFLPEQAQGPRPADASQGTDNHNKPDFKPESIPTPSR